MWTAIKGLDGNSQLNAWENGCEEDLSLSLYPFPLLEEWPLFVLLLRRWNLNSESKFARDSNSIRKKDFFIFRSKIIFALNNTIFSLSRKTFFAQTKTRRNKRKRREGGKGTSVFLNECSLGGWINLPRWSHRLSVVFFANVSLAGMMLARMEFHLTSWRDTSKRYHRCFHPPVENVAYRLSACLSLIPSFYPRRG